jgi:WhiB family transcriptional regulator, redox-sensing transcriptional regulator
MSWKDSAHWRAENEARLRLLRDRVWLESGSCRGLDPDVFFPERGQDERPAKRVCRTCPVRQWCLTYALDAGEKFGVWGGTSERQRRLMRAARRTGSSPAPDAGVQLVLITVQPVLGVRVVRNRGSRAVAVSWEQLVFPFAA